MQSILTIAFYIALAGIVVVLVLGIANLVRTDDKQASRSNKLMRMRVIFQAVAIALLVLIGVVAGAIKFGG
ncbi:MAG: twin transmembrane helix small protein [Hyphomonas sp.]